MDLTIFLHVTLESGFALFCILAALYLRQYKELTPQVTGVMSVMLLLNALINVSDALAYAYRGDTGNTAFYMVRICNFVVFAGMFALLAASGLLLETVLKRRDAGSDKRLRDAAYALCGAGIAVLVVSRLTGGIYGFDAGNVYHRAGGYLIIPVLAGAAIIVLMIRTYKEREALGKRMFALFTCAWLLPLAGAAVQYLYYGISLANIANSVAIMLMFVAFVLDAVRKMSIRKSFILAPASIDRISDDLEEFLCNVGAERQNRIRIRFTVEDALVRFRERFEDPTMVRVLAGIRFGRPYIKIDHVGDAFNPFSKTHNSQDEWSGNLLSSAGLSPAYSYGHGTNTIRITLGRLQINPVITIIIAILFGLILGKVGDVSLRTGDEIFITQGLLVPVYDLWNNMLYSVAAPAMLIIVMSTMLDTRDVSEQGGNAGRITGRYFAVSVLMGISAVIAVWLAVPDAFASEVMTRDTVAELIQKFFGIVPGNLLDPFKDFNTAQLILMGMVLAYAIMAIGEPVAGLASLIHQLNLVSTRLAQWIAGLMPLFTVFLTAQLLMEHNGGLLTGLFNIIPFTVFVSLLCMIAVLLYISRSMHVSIRVLIEKMWPSFALTLKSGQVADTYALAEKCCISDFGIQKIFTQNVFPLGLVLYMPVSMVGMVSFVVYAAFRSGIAITPVWVLTAIVFSLILLVAAPPIPGINLLSYVVIIEQLGIGKEYVIAAMIFDIIFNVFASAANQMLLQADLILQADRIGLINHGKLRSQKG